MLHDAQIPIDPADTTGQSEVKENRTMSPQEIADQTYREHEEEWLLEHFGEYAWVVGKQVWFFKTVEELQQAIMASEQSQPGITLKVERCERPVYYIS